MKKTVSKMLVCMMALAFMLGCVSCSLFKNYDYVNEAISKTEALNAATLEILTDIQTTANGTDETISSAYTVSMKDLQSAAPVFSADMNVTLYGETVPASVYYEGGYYYIETADERVKLTSGDLLEKTDFLSDWKRTTKPFTEEILETLIELDHADGTRTVSLLIDPADFQKNHESLLKIWQNTLSEKYGVKTDPQINVSDTKYQMMLDTETNTVKDFVSVCHMELSGKNETEENVSVSAFVQHKIVYRATDDAVSLKIPENHTDFELSDGIHYNAYNITKKAVDAATALKDLDILLTFNGTRKTASNSIYIPQSITVKTSGIGTDDWKFRDHTEYSIGELDYCNDIYYENGMYYVRTTDGTPDTRYQASDENYQEYCYQYNIEQIVCSLTQSDLSQAKTVKNADGSKTVTLTLPAVRFLQTHADLAEYFRDQMTDHSTFRSSDCEVEITVDHDGNLKLYRLKFVYSGDFSGECDMIMDVSVEYYHFGEAVTVEPLQGYETFLTVEEQKEAALAKADTAINEMLNADQMILYTYFYEDLMFGNRLVSASEISSRTYATDLQTSPRYRSSWVSIDGEETTEIEVYYANGYFYFWDENDQAKTPANGVPTEFKVPDYLKQHMKPLSDDMKNRAEMTNEEDGTSLIAIELSSEELQTFIPDVYDMYTEEALGMPISDVEFSAAYIYIYFDENGNFVSYEIEYEVDFKANMEGLMDIGFTHYKQICFEFERSSPITVSPPANYESFPLELMENE